MLDALQGTETACLKDLSQTHIHIHIHIQIHTCFITAYNQCCLADSSQWEYSSDACFSCMPLDTRTAMLTLCLLATSLLTSPAQIHKMCVSLPQQTAAMPCSPHLWTDLPAWLTSAFVQLCFVQGCMASHPQQHTCSGRTAWLVLLLRPVQLLTQVRKVLSE